MHEAKKPFCIQTLAGLDSTLFAKSWGAATYLAKSAASSRSISFWSLERRSFLFAYMYSSTPSSLASFHKSLGTSEEIICLASAHLKSWTSDRVPYWLSGCRTTEESCLLQFVSPLDLRRLEAWPKLRKAHSEGERVPPWLAGLLGEQGLWIMLTRSCMDRLSWCGHDSEIFWGSCFP